MARAPDEIVQIKFRAREQVRARLEAAAAKRGTSTNSEIVERLETSLEEPFDDPMAMALGRIVAFALRDAGRLAGFHSKRTIEGAVRWYDDPFAYDQAEKAAGALLAALRPGGQAATPASGAEADFAENIGIGTANSLIDETTRGISRTGERERAAFLSRQLGDAVVRLSRSSSPSPLYVDAGLEAPARGTFVLSNKKSEG